MAKHDESEEGQQSREGEPVKNLSLFEEQDKVTAQGSAENQHRTKSSMRVGKKRTLRDKWRLTSLSNKVITIATVIIAGAGVLTFGAAFFQWLEMRGGGKQTDRIIAADERLATAMENSVKEAGKSLNATIAQNQLDQRAWVGFADVQVIAQPGVQSRFSFNLKNTGKTPALHTTVEYFIKNVDRGNKITFTYKGIGKEPTRGVIPPNGAVSVAIANAIPSADEMNRIRNEDKRVYFYGRTTYSDIFGRPHWTTFCTYLARDGSAMVFCHEYNNTDEEEKKHQ